MLSRKSLTGLFFFSFFASSWAEKYPASTFTLSFGVNNFISSLEEQWGQNSGYFGRVEFLYKAAIPIGISANIGYDLCPVCDNTGGEYVTTVSAVGQFIPMKYPFQLLTGIGISKGKDPKNSGDNDEFIGMNIPLVIRILYNLDMGNTFLGFGIESSFDLNFHNRMLAFSIPIQWGIK